ncbi:ABC-three component system protein [Sorangium sp. So ce117]|uniref:ABC-three component system protein n=1 Tax=Sorangium sp. So ce117 TaxID=3133277 RepID=UPI003F60996E
MHQAPLRASKVEDSFASIENLKGNVDFAIITIKDEELAAVLEQFPAVCETVKANRDYAIIRVPTRPEAESSAAVVAVTKCPSQGNGISQDLARDIISDLDPQWLLLVGIAGGAPTNEFTLGDVVLASSLVDTTVEAVKEGRPPEFAAEGRLVHPEVENFASMVQVHSATWGNWNHLTIRSASGDSRIALTKPPVNPRTTKLYGSKEWRASVRESLKWHATNPRTNPIARAAMVASSDRLIKDDDVLATWMRLFRQIRAVEMESSGVYLAAKGRVTRHPYPAMSIRGISDIVGLRRDESWTRYACFSAAAFAYAFVRSGYVKPRSGSAKSGRQPTDSADGGSSSELNSTSPSVTATPGPAIMRGAVHIAPKPKIRIDSAAPNQLRWIGSHSPTVYISTCWGSPEGEASPQPGELVFEPAWRRHKALSQAVIRLGVHGGIGILYAPNPKLWLEAITRRLPGCIGTPEQSWEPREGLLGSSQQWCVSDLDNAPQWNNDLFACDEVHAADALATEIHNAMDAWIATRLDDLMSRLVNGIQTLPYPIHGDFLPEVEVLWQSWKSALEQSSEFRRHFLSTMLAVSDVQNSHDGGAALIRLGPRTVKSCVLEAVVFAMAVEIATRRGTIPCSGDRINLKHASQNAQLFGLRLIERFELDSHFGHLIWAPGYAFLAHARRPAGELRALSRRFSEPDEINLTLGRSDDTHVTIIPRDGGFLDGLRNGPEALAKHILRVIVAQDEAVRRRVMQSIQVLA